MSELHPDLGGWTPDPEGVRRVMATMPFPVFRSSAPHLAGDGRGKTVLLYKAFKDANGGSYIDYPAQRIGDCVSHGTGHGVDLLECVQITIGKKNEAFKQTATEAVYGLAREISGLKRPGRLTDGTYGAAAAKAVTTTGTVSRDVVGPYDGVRAGEWGWHGVPGDVRAKCPDHKVGAASLVSTYEELEDALANGYPVTVCSDQGFTLERDGNGFCRPYGSWGHCMLIVGVRADSSPGACIFQSWGTNDGPPGPYGPLALDQPPNSFWADRNTVSSMLARGDSWSLSSFEGYPGQALPQTWNYNEFI